MLLKRLRYGRESLAWRRQHCEFEGFKHNSTLKSFLALYKMGHLPGISNFKTHYSKILI